jgi:hypothetical protein
MHVSVVALYNAAGPITPLLYGRRAQVVLRKKLAVLLATVMMIGVMGVSPALADDDLGQFNNGDKEKNVDKEKKPQKAKKPGEDVPPTLP